MACCDSTYLLYVFTRFIFARSTHSIHWARIYSWQMHQTERSAMCCPIRADFRNPAVPRVDQHVNRSPIDQ
eukprot:957938-Rhodomonas_salina.1